MATKDFSRFFEIGENVLRLAEDADAAEVVVMAERSWLLRMASGRVHQPVAVENLAVGLRVRYGKKAGVAWVNSGEPDALRTLFKNAKAVAESSPEQELPELSEPWEHKPTDEGYDPKTAEVSPAALGEIAAKVIKTLRGKAEAFGTVSAGEFSVVLLNSKGLRLAHRLTDANLVVNPSAEDAWARVEQSAKSVDGLNPEAAAEKALERVLAARNPVELEPGAYEAVLEPLAFAEILGMLEWLGLSGRSIADGRSFLVGKEGERVFSEGFTLREDPASGYPWPFDFEGTRRRAFAPIERGVFKEPYLDLKTAKELGKPNNGCAAMPFGSFPYGLNMVVEGGARTEEELISSVKRGVLVTRLWYTNVVEPKTFTLTGMTRDGLFLIEDGKITRALKNMRFTQSMLEALSAVEFGKPQELLGSTEWYDMHVPNASLVPPIKLEKFVFSSKTEF